MQTINLLYLRQKVVSIPRMIAGLGKRSIRPSQPIPSASHGSIIHHIVCKYVSYHEINLAVYVSVLVKVAAGFPFFSVLTVVCMLCLVFESFSTVVRSSATPDIQSSDPPEQSGDTELVAVVNTAGIAVVVLNKIVVLYHSSRAGHCVAAVDGYDMVV